MRFPISLTDSRPALSEITEQELDEWVRGQHLPAYRARQVREAVERRCVQTLDVATDLPASVRSALSSAFRVRTIQPRVHLRSSADSSEKVLFGLKDGSTVETVLIPGRNSHGSTRATVCVSSQVGCPAGCTFCATGLGGFTRNLTAAEIVDQVAYFQAQLSVDGRRVTNVVYMGMGEPFLNPVAVRQSVARLLDPAGLAFGARSVTVSTVGIVPQVRRFADWAGQVNLAVSLHAPNDELREKLVPYNRHFPVAEILAAVQEYAGRTRRRVSFEYVLLKDENDAVSLARELASLLRPLGGLAHVNLIPWNPFREGKFIRSEGPDADAFAATLRAEGVNATIRYSKGLDISAACGQLREREAVTLAGSS